MTTQQKATIRQAAELLDSVYASLEGPPAERMQAVRDELDGQMLDCLLTRRRKEQKQTKAKEQKQTKASV